ncbi:hypothetical protein [Microbacterium sp. NPDC076911]|uniref:hypothetical protein n=1 Tax=Microbacterium sp. NPDC076911 TaxID=3154958 RepID=UPI003439A9AF
MAARTHHRSRAAQVTAIVAVIVLAVGVAALAMMALTQSRPEAATAPVNPVPTFTLGVDADAATASPSPTTQTLPAFVPAEERFLAVDSGVMWRGIAGECGTTAPVIERSTDEGATWVDVTPTYREIGQLLSLEPFADGQAEAVALVGVECEPQALRTFTQGEFWEPYPEVLASATYISPAAPGTVVLAGVEIEAPCGEPRVLRTAGGNTALICEGAVYVHNAALASDTGTADWLAVDVNNPVTVAASSGTVAVAHVTESCDGLSVTKFSAEGIATEPSECVAGVDIAIPAALTIDSPEGYTLWSGDSPINVG